MKGGITKTRKNKRKYLLRNMYWDPEITVVAAAGKLVHPNRVQ